MDRIRWDVLAWALRLLLFALTIRVGGAWLLGEGAPFGPDGTGAEASFFLGGHPYPLHMALLHLTGGDARALSIGAGSVSCVLLWAWGRRVGLGGAGGWLAAALPVCVLPGALAGGDAPAIAVVLSGALMSTLGRPWALAGGALAASAVAVKPIALPAMLLLVAYPVSLAGALPMLVLLSGFTRPLWQPMPDGGLLGTWWVSSGGGLPGAPLEWVWGGCTTLLTSPFWSGVVLLFVGLIAVGKLRRRVPIALAGLGVIAAAWGVAALFGNRMEVRYLSSSLWAVLPFVGFLFPRRRAVVIGASIVLLWPTAALFTQLGQYRAGQDPLAQVPHVPEVPFPIDVRTLFDASSTPDATRMRLLAQQIAEVAPHGATITTPGRPDGREGELFWPLQVLRPDIKVQSQVP